MSDKIIRMDKQGESKSKNIVIEGDAMERFADAFEASARRWELIVYRGTRRLRLLPYLYAQQGHQYTCPGYGP